MTSVNLNAVNKVLNNFFVNFIAQWKIVFENCTNLKFIDLDNNFLEYLNNRTFNLTNLNRIHLRNNRINSIADDFLLWSLKLEVALLTNNTCINESFPLTSIERLRIFFQQDCSPPEEITTMTPPRTTQVPRKKSKRPKQRIFYFESCKWHAPAEHRYF